MPILDYFIEHNPTEKAFNMTPDNSIELLKIAQLVKTISQKDIDIKVAQDGYGLEYSGDNSLLRKEIPTLQFTPIENSVKELYDWYIVNKNNLNKDLLITDK
jgi:GDP-L-fucose synthase